MLTSLTISNFALIDQAAIEFPFGLTIITGETGAGKSIIIDALACILGDRVSADSIRTGKEFLRVEAVFDLSGNMGGLGLLEELAIPVEDDAQVIIVRKVTATAKNTVLINGCQATVSTLKRLAPHLLDIHGQHESQALLRPELYISLLDQFSQELQSELGSYRQVYSDWKKMDTVLKEAVAKSQERERRLDMLTWQSDEIAAAKLIAGEDAELEAQIKILSNSERIAKSVHHAYALLSGNTGDGTGVTAGISEAKKALEQAARYDERLMKQVTAIEEALCQLQDAEYELQNYFQEMDFSPMRLTELQARMDVIYKLKRKYGDTTADILSYYAAATKEIEELKTIDHQIDQLRQQHLKLEAKLADQSNNLHDLRQRAARDMAQAIEEHLRDLGMQSAQFIAEVLPIDHYHERGRDQVQFLFTANRGEEPRPLNRVASGGELSRIALAMKAVIANQEGSPSMVFDELDAGIGGKTAQMVAEKIAAVAQDKQIICITHLPQIAVMGDRHIHIEKISDDQTTRTIVHSLDSEERENEIARMISGDDQSNASRTNAVTMLRDAKIKKEIWKKKAQA